MSKALKKLIDINRLREFKNKLVGAGSAYVQTAAVDQTVAGTKTFSKPIVGSVTGSSGSCTGNAATAIKATQDAAGNTITTTYATKAENNTKANDSDVVHKSGNETIAGTKTFSSQIKGNISGSSTSCTGNSASATKLATARTISLTGAVTGSTSFNGSANASINTALSNIDASKITSGTIDLARIPKAAIPELKIVANDTARFALTTSDIQNGDTVQVTSTGKMYYVKDQTKLSSEAGYAVYTAGAASSVPWSGVTGKPSSYTPAAHTQAASTITGLATVATSGSYTDLANKPAIPTVNNATLTIQKNGTTVKTFTANASANVTANITVPTKVSELTNDSGFLTSHQSLSNYVTLNGAQTISGAKTFTGNIIGINKERSTEDANSLYSTTVGSKLTYYTTSNGGTTLTNVPATVNTTLESRTIRRLSDSDWIVEQICHNSNGLYYRKGSNGTWGAWKTFAFTDSSISGNAATATTATTAKSCTGNAATATKLATARTIALSGAATGTATSFNGTANIAIPVTSLDASKLTGTASVSTTGNAATATTATTAKACTGNAATATKLAAKRTIALSGAATGTATAFDGSGNITIPVTALAASAIRAQWYAAYPDGAEAHNAMWGGRDITAAFNNGTVSANIKKGTFRDIFPGDYITKTVTISGKTYTVNWVVADCDYWWRKGDQNNGMETHHVVIVPQAPIFRANMNPTNSTGGGYVGSRMYKETIPACATGIVNAFGSSHILTFRDHLTRDLNTSAVSSGITVFKGAPNWNGAWYSQQCNLMSEAMVYDGPHCASSALDNNMATRQMSAFRLSEKLINYNRQWWWLRDIVSSTCFALTGGDGRADLYEASNVCGVRPFALLR